MLTPAADAANFSLSLTLMKAIKYPFGAETPLPMIDLGTYTTQQGRRGPTRAHVAFGARETPAADYVGVAVTSFFFLCADFVAIGDIKPSATRGG